MSEKAIFLDRDNTIIEDPGYISNPDQVKLLPGAADALSQFEKMGYKIVVATNQSAIARGILKENVLEEIHLRLRELLGREGAHVDAIYFCPYHPNGVIPKYCRDSELRKPNPGMLVQASRDMDINLEDSWMIGDSYSDITAGKRAGCRTILISSPLKPAYKKLGDPSPEHKAVNIKEAANIVMMHHRQQLREEKKQPEKVTEPEPQKKQKQAEAEAKESASKVSQEESTALLDAPPPPNPETATVKRERVKNIEKNTPAGQSKQAKGKGAIKEDRTQKILEELSSQLKSSRRDIVYREFSFFKLLSGVGLILGAFLIVISLWFLIDPSISAQAVHTVLGYAIALLLMANLLYNMKEQG